MYRTCGVGSISGHLGNCVGASSPAAPLNGLVLKFSHTYSWVSYSTFKWGICAICMGLKFYNLLSIKSAYICNLI